VLREIVSRIDQVVGNEGMVGRLGGDEIGVAVTGPEAHHRADRLASSIVHAVRTAIPVDGHTASISVSVGVAQSGSASTLDELVVHAELAMQAVKANGGDSYRWFEDWMVVPSITVAQTRSDFLASVEANQVSVVYQPIVAAETGRLMAVEALARWNRAGRELTPATFLAELDRAGLLPTLGTTVISQVGVDSEVIWRQHPELLIFVNLSTRELAAPEVIDVLLAGPLGDRPGHVVVEVTEQIEMIAQGPARASLTRLVDAGMKVAIDDFGSGYSSLERIVTVAPSVLKLDRFLIDHAMEHANQGSKVLETAIALGRSLGCVLVAEGVETEEERRVVTELGVTWVQGYLIARPAPLSSLGRFPSGMPEEI
jgi:two-component system CheB/CheR fusion protein